MTRRISLLTAIVLALCLTSAAAPAVASARSGSVPQRTATTDLDGYLALLNRVRADITQAELNRRRSAVRDALAALRSIHVVRIDGGQQITVNNADIAAELTAQPPDLLAAETRIDMLLTELDGLKGRPEPPASTWHDLRRLEEGRGLWYHLQDLWQNVSQTIARFIDSIAQRLTAPIELAASTNVGRIALIILGGLGVSAFLFGLLRGVNRRLARYLATAQPDAPETRDATAAQRQATLAASAGNYREAIRALLLSALLALDEAGLIVFDPALTNREYVSLVARARARKPEPMPAAVAEPLATLVETFDAVWYGNQPCTLATYTACEQSARQIGALRTSRAALVAAATKGQ